VFYVDILRRAKKLAPQDDKRSAVEKSRVPGLRAARAVGIAEGFLATADEKPEKRGLVDPGEDVAGVDGLTFFGLEAFDFAFFGGANFILHFHGFDDDQALAGFDFVADFYEKADDFAGHRGEDLLTAFGIERSQFFGTPGAGIADLGVEFVRAGL